MSDEQKPHPAYHHQNAEGDYIVQAQDDATATLHVINYEHVRPAPPDPTLLKEATRLFEELPLDYVPKVKTPPPGSVVPPMDPNPLFVGRDEELKELASKIKTAATTRGPVNTVCVYGLGGVGKTQLASEFAYSYGQYFKGGVYWLNLSNPDAVAEEIARCGGAGAMEVRGEFDRLPLADQVRKVKSEWQNDLPRLLVLDNCEDSQALKACRPTTGGCRVLLTNRGPFGDPALAVVSVELQVLDREASLELLRNRCPGAQMEEDDLVAVAKELGDLPLALDLAGRFLYAYGHLVGPSKYVEQLQAVEPLDHRSLRQSDGHSPTNHEMDVGRTFIVSYERLNRDDPTDRLAIRLLARAAHFAPGEQIEHPLLLSAVESASNFGEDSDEAPDVYQQADALRRLTDLGLVSASENGQLRIHRLVASFARLETDDAEAQSDVEATVADVAIDVAKDGHPVQLRRLLPHLRHMVESAAARDDELANRGRFALGAALLKLESYAEAVPFLEGAVRYGTEQHGATHCVTMRQRSDLGVALNRSGETDRALKIFEEVLENQERKLGRHHVDVASTLNNIGALLRDKGRFDEVLPMYERALEIRKNEFGWEHRDTAESLHNLGALMMDLERYEDAWPYLERALQVSETVMGSDHLDNVGPLVKMGFLLRREGKHAEARPYYERALKIRENALWPEHRDVVGNLHQLGMLLVEQESYEEAQPYLERAAEINDQALGDHPDTARSLDSLGNVLAAQEAYERARSVHERALAIYEQALGEHPSTAISMNNLAQVLQRLGLSKRDPTYFEKALGYQQRAITIFEATSGDNHPHTATTLHATAMSLQALGRLQEARPYVARSLSACENVFPLGYPFTEMVRENLRLLNGGQ